MKKEKELTAAATAAWELWAHMCTLYGEDSAEAASAEAKALRIERKLYKLTQKVG